MTTAPRLKTLAALSGIPAVIVAAGCTRSCPGEALAGPAAAMIPVAAVEQLAYDDIAARLGRWWGMSFSVTCAGGLSRITGYRTSCVADPMIGKPVTVVVTVAEVGDDDAFRLSYEAKP